MRSAPHLRTALTAGHPKGRCVHQHPHDIPFLMIASWSVKSCGNVAMAARRLGNMRQIS